MELGEIPYINLNKKKYLFVRVISYFNKDTKKYLSY